DHELGLAHLEFALQRRARFGREARVDADRVAATRIDAWRMPGLLEAHPVVEQHRRELQYGRKDLAAAGSAHGKGVPLVLANHDRAHVGEWPLTRADRIGDARTRVEPEDPVVHEDPG